MGKLVVANWKMNPGSEAEAVGLAGEVDLDGVVVCPPLAFVGAVGKVIEKAALGSQDVFWEEGGAYTGEVSAGELKSLGVEYVIVGHSERRALGDTDEMVNKKVLAGLGAGLKVILCVGESLEVRGKGIDAAKEFVQGQLERGLEGVQSSKFKVQNLLVAYEPVWAISSVSGGESDTPDNAVGMIEFIKETLKPRPYNLEPSVLYGGSVNAENAEGFLSRDEIDGVLVGGASLKPEEFSRIVEIASR